MENACQFSIVLPVYKPKGRWMEVFVQNLNELKNYFPKDISFRYIVVHDGPADASMISAFEVLSESFKNISFTSYSVNRGKGYALRQGIKMANTPYILTTDFDFPYRKENLTEVISFLKKGHDVVVGKRSKEYLRHLPIKRKIIFKLGIFLNQIFLGLPVPDTQSGIKGFNTKGKHVFMQTTIDRFLIDTEFVLRSYREKLSIKVIDVEVKPETEFSNFGFTVLKTELRNFLSLINLNKKLKSANITQSRIPAIHTTK
jgi:dolichyl-phosphate beta-glucosyltransferase